MRIQKYVTCQVCQKPGNHRARNTKQPVTDKKQTFSWQKHTSKQDQKHFSVFKNLRIELHATLGLNSVLVNGILFWLKEYSVHRRKNVEDKLKAGNPLQLISMESVWEV